MAGVTNYASEVQYEESRLVTKEQILGKGLNQPFTDSTSGVRKLMFAVHEEQALPLIKPEVPFIQTGYENRYADRSSSIIRAKSDYEVVAKICKFSSDPQRNYILILRDIHTNKLSMLERKTYIHTTETYGYNYNSSIMDRLDIGYEIPKGEILRKSLAYDEYNNSCAGVNLLAAYVATDITMEDGMLISESAMKKLASPLFKKVTVNINDNDLLLNLMGQDGTYKSFPDIGEEIQNGILCGVRREKTEDALFSQSVDRLRTILMSDDKYTIESGRVIDIKIRCNNPAILQEKYTNSQVLYYYNDHIRYITEIVNVLDKLMGMYSQTPETLDPDLGEIYTISKQELQGVQFLDQKVFSGTEVEFIVQEDNIPSIGDKIANRYGGKGVISKILPDELMPKIALTGEPLELCINSSTCVNRENTSQWHEISLTHIGKCIIDLARLKAFDTNETLQEILKFTGFCSYEEASYMAGWLNSYTEEEKDIYVQSIIDANNIVQSIKPITESMSLDQLAEIYRAFPYVRQRTLEVPIMGSDGNYRYINARRPVVVGHIYMYRLKQYAEEKHSVTALSSTNIRNENSRSKANKNYKALKQSTPIRFGDMETGDFGHLGMEYVITTLMIHSVSPQARRLVEKIFTGDPYLVNIKLDDSSSNRSAEILNAYLKVLGYRLEFTKTPKKMVKPFTMSPFVPYDEMPRLTKVFYKISEEENIDPVEWLNHVIECEEKISKKPFMIYPMQFGRD